MFAFGVFEMCCNNIVRCELFQHIFNKPFPNVYNDQIDAYLNLEFTIRTCNQLWSGWSADSQNQKSPSPKTHSFFPITASTPKIRQSSSIDVDVDADADADADDEDWEIIEHTSLSPPMSQHDFQEQDRDEIETRSNMLQYQ